MTSDGQQPMFAMDLDGTLLDGEERIHPEDRAAIACALARGVIVTIATGRLTSRTHPTARSLQLRAPLICADGGVLVCSLSERVLQRRPISSETTRRLLELVAATGLAGFVFTHDSIHASQRGRDYASFVRGWSQSFTCHADILAACDRQLAEAAVMVVVIGEAARVDSLERRLAGLELGLGTGRFEVGGAQVLRLMAAGTSKGSALRDLAERIGVVRENLAVVGDWYNDLSMFEVASHSYAMPHAPAVLRERASHVLDAAARQRGAIASALRHWLSVLG